MGSENKEITLEQPTGTVVKTTEKSNGLISNLLKKFTENKIYLYVAIGIIVLGIVAFYYFKKCKKDVKNKSILPKQSNAPFIGLNNEDHFILDANGNPVKVTGSFQNQTLPLPLPLPLPIPKQQPSQKDVQMLQKQMHEKQMMQQQKIVVNKKTKLQHPESEMSDEIEIDLDDIEENEDENVAQHNLTNSELAEINKKIEMMNSQK